MRPNLTATQLREIIVDTFVAMSPHATPWLRDEAAEREARDDSVFGSMLRYLDELEGDGEVDLYPAVVQLIEEDARLMAYTAYKLRDADARHVLAAVG